MSIKIAFDSMITDITEQDSLQLIQLAEKLEEECNVKVQTEYIGGELRTKNGGIAIGLAIATLGVTVIGTLIQVLSYWKSLNPKYSITFKSGNITFLIDNISGKELRNLVSKLEDENSSSEINVLIS